MTRTSRCTILSPTAILGYGFPEESFLRGIAAGPDVIAVDAGSTDPGPYYLGSGKPFTNREGVKRDLTYMISSALELKIPVIVGTAGGSGSKDHVEWTLEIVREILGEQGLHAKVGVIYADIETELILRRLQECRVSPLTGVAPLTEESVLRSERIVAQMGYEPMIEALDAGCDIVLAGRAYDPACFAAYPIRMGFDPGLALHAGKILECAAIAATPGSGSDCVLGIIEEDSFLLQTLSDERRFTTESTCAHTLYEKSDPYHLPGPGGSLDLEKSVFEETEDGVRVSGTVFVPTEKYMIKLEAAMEVGFRTISIAGTRDPIMISQLDEIIETVKEKVSRLVPDIYSRSRLMVHQYGKDGVMGPLEPESNRTGHEIALLIDALSDTQEHADTICSLMRSSLLHYGYPGRVSTAGNLAFPFSPSDIPAGRVYEFSMYHLMETEAEDGLFRVKELQI